MTQMGILFHIYLVYFDFSVEKYWFLRDSEKSQAICPWICPKFLIKDFTRSIGRR